MDKKLVSVIVPCYNVEKYVKKTLNSLLKQTYKNTEIIAVDDGSTDNTFAVLKEYEGKVKVISQKNKGLAGARNTGIKNSNGDYICFVDSDDFVSKDYVSVLVKNIEKFDADISVVGYKKIKENEKAVANKKIGKIKIFYGEDAVKEYFSQKNVQLFAWNKLYKKEILNGQLFNEEVKYGEDQSFNYFYLSKCKKMVYCDKRCYYYLQRNNSLVLSPYSKKKYTCFIGLNEMVKDSEKKKKLVEYTRAWKALICIESLFFIFKTKFNDKKITTSIMKQYKENAKYIRKAKNLKWYIRYFAPLSYPFFRLALRKNVK